MSREIAFLCMGQLWCPGHCEYDQEDLDQGYVVPITEFDMVGEGHAESVSGSCCHGCGVEF